MREISCGSRKGKKCKKRFKNLKIIYLNTKINIQKNLEKGWCNEKQE